MMCLAWSHAAFQGKQDRCRSVGEVSPTHRGDKVSPGDILGDPDWLGVNTQLMYRGHLGQGRIPWKNSRTGDYSTEELKPWELFYTS